MIDVLLKLLYLPIFGINLIYTLVLFSIQVFFEECILFQFTVKAEQVPRRAKRHLPSREEQIKSLQTEQFDVLIVGGGATGAGCALDATTRGLKTALVEADDFASGTSSRSTKLIHGGVRYLQKAIMQLDIEQYKMVKEALNERASMLNSAPHLAHPLPIMLPVYT